jgi:hypothetical protein
LLFAVAFCIVKIAHVAQAKAKATPKAAVKVNTPKAAVKVNTPKAAVKVKKESKSELEESDDDEPIVSIECMTIRLSRVAIHSAETSLKGKAKATPKAAVKVKKGDSDEEDKPIVSTYK